ncbi:hypothetical protein SNE40_010932 [Patella caerulea]|uniref:Nuclear envelope integral membrane protein 1-like n=1 Tax=Patella caerulea TaxID=87958 RepID=A0AAN8JRB3_PATCE
MAPKIYFKTILVFLNVILTLSSVVATSTDPFYDCREPACFILDNGRVNRIYVEENIFGNWNLATFCHRGQIKDHFGIWINPVLTIFKRNQDQEISYCIGKNLTEVQKKEKYIKVDEYISLQAFESSCVGILSVKPYTVQFKVINPDVLYIAYVIAGIFVFFRAPQWSRNLLVHYVICVSVVLLASGLLLIYIRQLNLQQRLVSDTDMLMLAGVSPSLLMLQWMLTPTQDEVQDNRQHFGYNYMLVTGLISVISAYRFAPMTDYRSLNLLQWMLQIIGLALIYNGTQIAEASAAIIIMVVSAYMFPATQLQQRLRYIFLPPESRFLTEEEYEEERDRETEKALEELRQYCKSPECQKYKVISRLKSPSRFASFVNGGDHLSDTDSDVDDYIMSDDDYHSHSDYSHLLSRSNDDYDNGYDNTHFSHV